MPSVDGSGNLLSAGANYNAGDWATVGAETSLDLVAVANLNRGVDISDAADDFVGGDFSFPRRMEAAGSGHFDKLCDNFAGFLAAGLASGMAEWPPNPW